VDWLFYLTNPPVRIELGFDEVTLASFQRAFCFTVKVFPAINIVPTRAWPLLLTDTE
jgi:hypothetical protein